MFRKRRIVALGLLLLSAAWAIAPGRPAVAGEQTALRWRDVIVDWRTGLALHGIDPVAYFVERRPVPGLEAFETPVAGMVWRFRNAGNRAAFIKDPDVYVPQFGGFDPMAAGRNVAVAGSPLIWAMQGERLYFFHNEGARRDFLVDPKGAAAAAAQNWPGLVESRATKGAGSRS